LELIKPDESRLASAKLAVHSELARVALGLPAGAPVCLR